MKENVRPIICLSFPAWDGNYAKSTIELMKAMSVYREVLLVDYGYTWKDVLLKLFLKKGHAPLKHILGLASRMRKAGDLYIWSLPPLMPVNALKSGMIYTTFMKWNTLLMKRSIRKAQRKLGFTSPVLINAFLPAYGLTLRGVFNESLCIYYCYDEIRAASWVSRHGGPAEESYIAVCDALVCSSRSLLEKKRLPGKPAIVVPNGVDPAFLRPRKSKTVAQDLPLNAPIIGYIGAIDDRIDYDLLEDVMLALPAYQFVFIGKCDRKAYIDRLCAAKNCHYIGPQNYLDLPGILAHMRVGIIPFLRNPFTMGIYPMKINEYLGAGLPVVSTRFGDMDDFSDIVSLTDSRQGFIIGIDHAIRNDSIDAKAARIAFASQQTWDQRARQLSAYVGKLTDDTLPNKILYNK